MLEGRQEFGKRNRRETTRPEAVPLEKNFEKDRPMYERLRDNDPKMNELLTAWDAVGAFQESGHGVARDAEARQRLERQIEVRFDELKQKN